MKNFFLILLCTLSLRAYSQYTAIPDEGFETALIAKGLDDELDGQVLTSNINSITKLDINNADTPIWDVTGIEDFVSLTTLSIGGNRVQHLDVRNLKDLVALDCSGNWMLTLNIDGLEKLQSLGCGDNFFTTLNISSLKNLTSLGIEYSRIKELDFTKMPKLRRLHCYGSILTRIDLSNCPDFEFLDGFEMPLKTLTLTGLTKIKSIRVTHTEITTLDVSASPGVTYLEAQANPNMSCIKVFDEDYANTMQGVTYFRDGQARFSESCDCLSTAILATRDSDFTKPVSGATNLEWNCSLVASLTPLAGNPVSGPVRSRVWVESSQPEDFVRRHYEITPASNSNSATARVTLYFSNSDFSAFNATSPLKLLPVSSNNPATMASRKANILIEKRNGISSNGTGLPGSYSGGGQIIDPDDNDIVWNSVSNRWEVSFNVTGFSAFFLRTDISSLPLRLVRFSVKTEEHAHRLEWATAEEKDTKEFQIESSFDGRSFKNISTISSVGHGDHNYYYDDHAGTGQKTYYRLKMVDIDDSFTYSKIVHIDAKSSQIHYAYPNPAQTEVYILVGKDLLNSNALLYNESGKMLSRISIDEEKLRINTTPLAGGKYFVKFPSGKTIEFVKE